MFLDHVFDPMIGASDQGRFTYQLADHFEMTADFRQATIRLRTGVTFHHGPPVTAADVKFTYENYSGVNAAVFREKTRLVELVDERTVTFYFHEPFPDFLTLYGSTASGAGYIVPQEYYQRMGAAGFAQAPIGAGAYRVSGSADGPEIVLEAFTGYWRKVPHVQTIITRGVPDVPQMVADLLTGRADLAYFATTPLPRQIAENSAFQVDPNSAAAYWLFFPGLNEPENPFADQRVREAVSLALDRAALAAAETGGLGQPTGNFIPPGKPGRVERPAPLPDLARAQRLMAEAGFPQGFVLDAFTPQPPAYALGERILTALSVLGIRGELQITSQAQFEERLQRHRAGFPGVQLAFVLSPDPPDAGGYFQQFARCEQGWSVNCDATIEELMNRYQASLVPAERQRLLAELQTYTLDRFIFVPLYLAPLPIVSGPRVQGNLTAHTRVHPYLFPYEDLQLTP
jgi:peptide/nickel transport system substrate-binding protein